ncbi:MULTISPECIES: hypothetical protein [Pseudofrankia]
MAYFLDFNDRNGVYLVHGSPRS